MANWHFREQTGDGDQRAYALLQFLPMLLTPLILALFESRFSRTSDLWSLLAWYLLAKLFEIYDHEIHDGLGVISKHSLKHITAGVACLVSLRHLRLREALAH